MNRAKRVLPAHFATQRMFHVRVGVGSRLVQHEELAAAVPEKLVQTHLDLPQITGPMQRVKQLNR